MTTDDLKTVYDQTFSQNDISDKQFTSQNLDSNGELFVQNVLPGGVTIVDNNNMVVLADQYQKIQNNVCVGINIKLKDFNVTGLWKIRYNRGMRGQTGGYISGVPPAQDIIIYSLIFS